MASSSPLPPALEEMEPNLEEWIKILNGASYPSAIEQEIELIMMAVKDVIDTSDMFPDEDTRKEALLRLTEYFNQQELKTTSTPTQPLALPEVFQNIKSFMPSIDKNVLGAYVKSLYEECMEPENKQRYEKWKLEFLNKFLSQSADKDHCHDPQPHQETPNTDNTDMSVAAKEGTIRAVGFSAKWLLRQVLQVSDEIIKIEFATTLDELLRASGTHWDQFLSTMVTSLGTMGVIAIYNLWCYQKGTRSWDRLKKNIIDNTAAVAFGNGVGWAAQGLLTIAFGPLGFWGGFGVQVAAGVAVGYATSRFVSKWTLKYYGLTKTEALESAYRTLCMPTSATDDELGRCCRALSRQYHPDYLQRQRDPPSEKQIAEAVEKFIEIQNAFRFIRSIREADRAARDLNEDLGWKENFMSFVKNLVLSKGKDDGNEQQELIKCIDFETTGFTSVEVLEQVQNNIPMSTVGTETEMKQQSVRSQWWKYFCDSVGSSV